MPELKHHFQTDPRDEDWIDAEDSDYDFVSYEKPSPEYVDDVWDY